MQLAVNIRKAINEIFRSNNKCDLVTFYFSGYGVVDETTNERYLAPYDMDPDDPQYLWYKYARIKKNHL